MVDITIRYPLAADIQELAEKMRRCDIDELCAVTDLSPYAAVKLSVEASHHEHIFAAHIDNKLLCIGGCSITGNPWLLATDELYKYSKLVTIEARRNVLNMLEKWPVLSNIVDARNTQAIRWLKVLGFQFREETYELKPGYPILLFEMRANNV